MPTPGLVAHFTPGQIAMGFVEATYSRYEPDQLISWDFLDFAWAEALRPWFVIRPWHPIIEPSVVAKLPLLGSENFAKRPNPKLRTKSA